ncbi:hypothetical protein D1BOALGB6SA_8718 [Olavius sp. associated proteobacterium Delta 1]|nr:hypothetical protein D1BOALGB6SA_8718 [Olavius sp. associated proteobacterium Delta 1]
MNYAYFQIISPFLCLLIEFNDFYFSTIGKIKFSSIMTGFHLD